MNAWRGTYRCQAGERLAPWYRTGVGKSRAGTYVINYVNRAACRGCGLRERCTRKTCRSIMRLENESTMERMAERLAARPEVMVRRRKSVERPFGSIKQWMGQGAFLTRRLGNVRGEFSFTALAYNLRRAINLVGIPALIVVVARWPGYSPAFGPIICLQPRVSRRQHQFTPPKRPAGPMGLCRHEPVRHRACPSPQPDQRSTDRTSHTVWVVFGDGAGDAPGCRWCRMEGTPVRGFRNRRPPRTRGDRP